MHASVASRGEPLFVDQLAGGLVASDPRPARLAAAFGRADALAMAAARFRADRLLTTRPSPAFEARAPGSRAAAVAVTPQASAAHGIQRVGVLVSNVAAGAAPAVEALALARRLARAVTAARRQALRLRAVVAAPTVRAHALARPTARPVPGALGRAQRHAAARAAPPVEARALPRRRAPAVARAVVGARRRRAVNAAPAVSAAAHARHRAQATAVHCAAVAFPAVWLRALLALPSFDALALLRCHASSVRAAAAQRAYGVRAVRSGDARLTAASVGRDALTAPRATARAGVLSAILPLPADVALAHTGRATPPLPRLLVTVPLRSARGLCAVEALPASGASAAPTGEIAHAV